MKKLVSVFWLSLLVVTNITAQKVITKPIELGFKNYGKAFSGTYQIYYNEKDEIVRHGNLTINDSDGSTSVSLNAVYNKDVLNGAFTYKYYSSAYTTDDITLSGNFINGEPTGIWKYHWSGTEMARSGMYDYVQKAPDKNIELTIKDKNIISYKNGNVSIKKVNGMWTGKVTDYGTPYDIVNNFDENNFYDTKGNTRNCEATHKELIHKYIAGTITADSLLGLGYVVRTYNYTIYFPTDIIKERTADWLGLNYPPSEDIEYYRLRKVVLLTYEEGVDLINKGNSFSSVAQYYMSTSTNKELAKYYYNKKITDIESLMASSNYNKAYNLLNSIDLLLDSTQSAVVAEKRKLLQQKIFEQNIENADNLMSQKNYTQAEKHLKSIVCNTDEQSAIVEKKLKAIQELRDFQSAIDSEIKNIYQEYKKITRSYVVKDLSFQSGTETYYKYQNIKRNPFWLNYETEISSDVITDVVKDYQAGIFGFVNVYTEEQLTYVLAYVKYSYILHQASTGSQQAINDRDYYKKVYETSKKVNIELDKIKEIKDLTIKKCSEKGKKTLNKKYGDYYNSIVKSSKKISNWTTLDSFMTSLFGFYEFSEKVQSICDVADTKTFETQLKSTSEPEQIKKLIMEYK